MTKRNIDVGSRTSEGREAGTGVRGEFKLVGSTIRMRIATEVWLIWLAPPPVSLGRVYGVSETFHVEAYS